MRYDWVAIEKEYITGNISLEDLANKYGMTKGTIMNRSAKGRWSEKRKNFGEKKVSSMTKKAQENAEYRYELFERKMNQAVENLMDKAISASESVVTAKAMKVVADTLKTLKDIIQENKSFPKKLAEMDAKIKKLSAEADALDKAKDVMEGGLKVEWTNGEWMNEDSAADAES